MSIKICYSGDISPIRIKAYSAILDNWKTGEIRELDAVIANKILKDNKDFSRADNYSAPKMEKPIVKKYTKTDLINKSEEEQIEILRKLGLSFKEIGDLKYESQRVKIILEKQ